MARSRKVSEIIGKLNPAQRLELERMLYVPGKPNAGAIARWLSSQGYKITDKSIAGWWESEGSYKYHHVPAQGALNAMVAIASAEYNLITEMLAEPEVREARMAVYRDMATREDGQHTKGVLALAQAMRELEKSIRTTAERIHNLEVRQTQQGIVAATATQAIAYLLQTLRQEGLESINLENLETLGDSVIERIMIENRIHDPNL